MSDDFSIDTRAGLPEHLRVLADRYPREMWRGHDNFNELTAFWLDRHLMFRQVLDKLIDQTQEFLDGRGATRFGPDLSRYSSFFINQLHGRHGIEDHHYFPQFKPLDSRVEKAFDLLDSDHHALDGHLHALTDGTNAVLKALQAGTDARDAAGALLDQHGAFKVFLDRHLTDEEEVIVPLVLEYGEGME